MNLQRPLGSSSIYAQVTGHDAPTATLGLTPTLPTPAWTKPHASTERIVSHFVTALPSTTKHDSLTLGTKDPRGDPLNFAVLAETISTPRMGELPKENLNFPVARTRRPHRFLQTPSLCDSLSIPIGVMKPALDIHRVDK